MYTFILLLTIGQLPMDGFKNVPMKEIINPTVYSCTDKFGVEWKSTSQKELNDILVRENEKCWVLADNLGRRWKHKSLRQLKRDIAVINEQISGNRQPPVNYYNSPIYTYPQTQFSQGSCSSGG